MLYAVVFLLGMVWGAIGLRLYWEVRYFHGDDDNWPRG